MKLISFELKHKWNKVNVSKIPLKVQSTGTNYWQTFINTFMLQYVEINSIIKIVFDFIDYF